jgi:hypothetical protein
MRETFTLMVYKEYPGNSEVLMGKMEFNNYPTNDEIRSEIDSFEGTHARVIKTYRK